MSDEPALRLQGLTKRFGETVAVDEVSLDVRPGELVTLLGPSGCGKTTTLRLIAGFEKPDAGRVLVEGRDITSLPPQRRGVGMVFQNYALFPHLDVGQNVEFGLRTRGDDAASRRERVADALARVDLAGYEKRRVQQLSGGQQQRVALARALAPEPPLLLLDEPLSNLDAALRERTRLELRTLLERLGITSIFVTHDQEEAFALADRVVLMNAGRVEQVDAPGELYHAPVTEFVAGFVGRANFLDGVVRATETDDEARVLCELPAWRARWWAQLPRGADLPDVGDHVRLMIRPEDLEMGPPPEAGAGALSRLELGGADMIGSTPAAHAARTRVERVRFAGSVLRYEVKPAIAATPWDGRPEDEPAPEVTPVPTAPGGHRMLVDGRDVGLEEGDVVGLTPRMDSVVLAFPAGTRAQDAL